MSADPDDMLSVKIGEFLFNLRSSLDHLAVACAPKKRASSASFPIVERDPWERDSSGRYKVRSPNARRSFRTAITRMASPAQAIVKRLQPYQMGKDSDSSLLFILNSLHNADKHRRLIVLGSGVTDFRMTIKSRGSISTSVIEPFWPRGGQLAKFGTADWPRVTPNDFEMDARGTASVAIHVGASGRSYELPHVLDDLLTHVRDEVVPRLEPFARSP